MHLDYLIVGQGISGSWLSYYLHQEGKSFRVIDEPDPLASSRIAAGIINPVTGRRHVTVWMADTILPFAAEAYKKLGHELSVTAISQRSIIDFFPSPQMRESFLQRVGEKNEFVHSYPEQNHFNDQLRYDFGCGEIRPVYIAHLETILPAWRSFLLQKELLIGDRFAISELGETADGIRYREFTAGKIIFCDGNPGASNPFFQALPFAPNKGEVLMAEIPDLPPHHIYKKGMMLVPLAPPGLFWVGSSYQWDFENAEPTNEFRTRTEYWLNDFLKVPFKIISHLAGVRPATLERRPFVGLHPTHPHIGILNGMGTKGCSLAPYFARQLADHLVYKSPIDPDADISRFRKILSRELS